MMIRGRILPTLIATLAVVGGACTSNTAGPDPSGPRGGGAVMSLVRADSCESFGDWVRDQATDHVGAYGLSGTVGAAEGRAFDEATARPAPAAATDGSDSGGGENAATTIAESATGTNNQEADVDEADLVKTDGTRVVVANGNRLEVFSLVNGAPYLDAAVDLGEVYASRLFLIGDTAYVLGDGGFYGGMPVPIDGPLVEGGAGSRFDGDATAAEASVSGAPVMASGSKVVQVDLSGDPAVVDTVTVEGSIVDGRMADGTIRLVVRSAPADQLGFVYPQSSGAEDAAATTNRRIVAESDPTDWIPKMMASDGEVSPLVSCSNVSYPQEFAGFGTVSVVTISGGLDSLTATAVTADVDTVYASAATLYIAVSRWGGFDPSDTDAHVDIHAFATAGSAPAEYVASGRVDGTLLNQYSLSERDGHLRVATTTMPAFDCPANADCALPDPENGISVLARSDDRLEEVGRVGGLGKGEQIQSVRFMGDTAYMVTFRQTDPFYVIDLADPEAPRMLGELKVPGFSSYLHPVGDDLVLGVGSDADAEGRITGAKVSLYDTSDPLNPAELSTWTDPAWSFMVAGDPKAFTFDAASQRVFLPAYGSGICDDALGRCASPANSVLVFSTAGGGLALVGWVDHGTRTPSPQPRPDPPTDGTTTTTSMTPTTTPETTTTTTPAPTTTEPGTTPSTGVGGGAATSVAPVGDSLDDVVAQEPTLPTEPDFPDPAYAPTITRAFVIDGLLVTVSDQGIATHLVPALTLVGFAAFG